MLWRATLEAAKEKSPNLALDDIAKDGSQLAAISRNLNIDGKSQRSFLNGSDFTLQFIRLSFVIRNS